MQVYNAHGMLNFSLALALLVACLRNTVFFCVDPGRLGVGKTVLLGKAFGGAESQEALLGLGDAQYENEGSSKTSGAW